MFLVVQFFVQRSHFDWFVAKKLEHKEMCGFEQATCGVGYMLHHQVKKRKDQGSINIF
jgi:hypothetical protein